MTKGIFNSDLKHEHVRFTFVFHHFMFHELHSIIQKYKKKSFIEIYFALYSPYKIIFKKKLSNLLYDQNIGL